MVVALLAALIYLAVGFAAGLHVKAGAAGVLVMLALALLIALGVRRARRVRRAADRLRRGRAGRLPAVLRVPVPVLGSASRATLIEQDWFRTIATYNPVSYLFEGLRSPIIFGWDGAGAGARIRLRDP